MSQISTAVLSGMIGCSKRQVQRMLECGKVPSASRSKSGRWLIVESEDFKKWVSNTARLFERKKAVQHARFYREEEIENSMPKGIKATSTSRKDILKRKLDRQIRGMMKTIDEMDLFGAKLEGDSPILVSLLLDSLQSIQSAGSVPTARSSASS